MKRFVLVLFILLFGFGTYAQDNHNCYGKEVVQKDIDAYKEEAKKCHRNFDQEAKAAETTSRMLRSTHNAVSCYMDIIYMIIDKYYSEKAAEHKDVVLKYIKQSYETYDAIYMMADECGANGCGSMYYVLSRDLVAGNVEAMTEEYIQILQQSLDKK